MIEFVANGLLCAEIGHKWVGAYTADQINGFVSFRDDYGKYTCDICKRERKRKIVNKQVEELEP